jgi:hypothetical protein
MLIRPREPRHPKEPPHPERNRAEWYTVAALGLLSILASAGCYGPFVAVAHVDPTSARTLEVQIKIYTAADLAGTNYATLGEIAGTSCRNKLWDSRPSEADALMQLRFKAFTRHANGVILWGCDSYGTDLSENCWSSITCRGTMIYAPQPVTE